MNVAVRVGVLCARVRVPLCMRLVHICRSRRVNSRGYVCVCVSAYTRGCMLCGRERERERERESEYVYVCVIKRMYVCESVCVGGRESV